MALNKDLRWLRAFINKTKKLKENQTKKNKTQNSTDLDF